MKNKLNNLSILNGLLIADRQILANFIVMYRENTVGNIALSKGKDVFNSVKNKIDENASSEEIVKSQSLKIENEINLLINSDLSDDELRLILFDELCLSFDSGILPITPNNIKTLMLDISSEFFKLVKSKNKDLEIKSFENAIATVVNNLFKSYYQGLENELEKNKFVSAIKQDIVAFDDELKYIAESTIKNQLLVGSGLFGFMGAVQASGFSAYILAAQSSAIIPFLGGKTAVSLLAVASSPLFILPLVVGLVWNQSSKYNSRIRKELSIVIIGLLSIIGKENNNSIYKVSEYLINNYSNVKYSIYFSYLRLKEIKKSIRELGLENNLPYCNNSILEKMNLNAKNSKNLNIVFDKSIDDYGLLTVTAGDIIYNSAMVDSEVIKALDFSRKEDIDSILDFSIFSDKILQLKESSFDGNINNLMGYTAERFVAAKLVEEGCIVRMPETSNQAGFDLFVDGKEFQVKCISPDNIKILENHFEKYPEIPVFVNNEVLPYIMDREWADKVYTVANYLQNDIKSTVLESVESASGLIDNGLLSNIALVSFLKNIYNTIKRKITLKDASENIIFDTLTKSTSSFIGGVLGSSIGFIAFGPAGLYILGGLGAFSGASKSYKLVGFMDKHLLKEKESLLNKEINSTLSECNKHLEYKISLLKEMLTKIDGSNDSQKFVKFKIQWQILEIKQFIMKNNSLIKSEEINATERLKEALKLITTAKVHPFFMQKSYLRISDVLKIKASRMEGVCSIIKNIQNKF
jgi:hypothetical protein